MSSLSVTSFRDEMVNRVYKPIGALCSQCDIMPVELWTMCTIRM